MSKGYASLKITPESGRELESLFKLAGINAMPKNKMHVTLMYDESNPEIEVTPKQRRYSAKVTGVERMGKRGSKWEAIALTLSCPEIEARHRELKKMGFKHSYNEFKCHMSIAYKPKSTDIELANLLFKLGNFPDKLYFSDEQWEEIKE